MTIKVMLLLLELFSTATLKKTSTNENDLGVIINEFRKREHHSKILQMQAEGETQFFLFSHIRQAMSGSIRESLSGSGQAKRKFENGDLVLPNLPTSQKVSFNFTRDNLDKCLIYTQGIVWDSEALKWRVIHNASVLKDNSTQTMAHLDKAGSIPVVNRANGNIKSLNPVNVGTVPFFISQYTIDSPFSQFSSEAISLSKYHQFYRNKDCYELNARNNIKLYVECKTYRILAYFKNYPDNKISKQIDYYYSDDLPEFAQLTSWTETTYGRESERLECTTMSIKKLSLDVNDIRFELPDFDKPKWVNDLDSKSSFIVKTDGVERPIGKGEYNGHNLEQLLEDRSPWRRNLISCLIIILLITASLLYFRRYRSNRRTL